MVEVVGDSSRDGRWALVRLAVEGRADRQRRGRRARAAARRPDAARGGRRRRRRARGRRARERARAGLPRRAEAGPRRGGDERRRRQRGRAPARGPGRDRRDAAALARPAGPRRRARLLLARGRARRARDLPPARHPARDARPARGVPRARWSSRSFAATRAGETPNPCIRCNGSFRFAELLAFAERAGAERLATGHYARIVERDGRLLLARAADERKDQSYMLARLDPRFLDRLWFPLGEQGKDETRAEAARAGLAGGARAPRARRRASSPAATTATSSSATGSAAEDGPVVDEDGNELGRHAGFWRFTPGQRKGLGVAARRAALRAAQRGRGRTPSSSARARRSRSASVTRPRAAARRRSSGPRRSCATARRRSARPSTQADGGFRLELDQPAYGVAPGQAAVLYDGGAVVGAGTIVSLPKPAQPLRAF